MLFLFVFLVLLFAAIAWLEPRKPRVMQERRQPAKRPEGAEAIAERRKDDDVGGEGG